MRTDLAPSEGLRRAAFRKDIQGLRGLAVVLVVAYHTGYMLPGGFVGVDVFFVLSGYLIIGLLYQEAERTGSLNLSAFFARRVRRLLPVLSLVITVTVVASTAFVQVGPPLQAVVDTAVGAAFIAANAVLYRLSDYFAPAAELNPLLHSWSLSIEEQFYIVVPITLALVTYWRGSASRLTMRSRWLAALATIAVASFLANIALVDLGYSVQGIEEPLAFAFYAPLTRAWQFAIGGLLALWSASGGVRSLRTSRILLRGGLFGILLGALLFDSATPFPGLAAIVPSVSTLLVLAAGQAPRGRSSGYPEAALSSSAAVRIGDLSYSWYLWHWPFIVFGKAMFGDRLTVVLAAVALSLIAATASHRFVEERFRRDRSIIGVRAARLLVLAVLLPSTLALIIGAANGRAAEQIGVGVSAQPWAVEDCGLATTRAADWQREKCVRASQSTPHSTRVDVLLIGDSHALSLSEGVAVAAERLDLSLGVLAVGGQPPVGDSEWAAELASFVRDEAPQVLIIANRSSNELDDENIGAWSNEPELADPVATWGVTVRQDVERFASFDAHVIWVLNVPEFPGGRFDQGAVPTLLRPGVRPREISMDELRAIRGPAIESERSALAGLEGVTVLDPSDVLCGSGSCLNAADDRYLYVDSHHLSSAGSVLLSDLFQAALEEALQP